MKLAIFTGIKFSTPLPPYTKFVYIIAFTNTSKLRQINQNKIKMTKLKTIVVFAALAISCLTLKAETLKIIAYNVEFGKSTTPKEIAKLLGKTKADVICFNEVPIHNWTKEVGKHLEMNYVYEGEVSSANHCKDFKDKTGKYYGKYKSILSKYPLKNGHEIVLKGVSWSPASVVSADLIMPNGKKIQVMSLHIPTGDSKPEESKAKHLADLLNQKFVSSSMIICGDYNDLVDSKTLSYMFKAGFSNCWKSTNKNLTDRTTYVYGAGTRETVIDHIFYKGVKILDAGIIEEKKDFQSDHKPIWSSFEIE